MRRRRPLMPLLRFWLRGEPARLIRRQSIRALDLMKIAWSIQQTLPLDRGGATPVVVPLHGGERLLGGIVGLLEEEVPLAQKLLQIGPPNLLELSPGTLHRSGPQPLQPVRVPVAGHGWRLGRDSEGGLSLDRVS